MTDAKTNERALEHLLSNGNVEGAHHLRWVIDQAVRILAGDRYDAEIKEFNEYRDEDGNEYPAWDVGIPP